MRGRFQTAQRPCACRPKLPDKTKFVVREDYDGK